MAASTEQAPMQLIGCGLIKTVYHLAKHPHLKAQTTTILCGTNDTESWIRVWEMASIREWKHLSHDQVCAALSGIKRQASISSTIPRDPPIHIQIFSVNGYDFLNIDVDGNVIGYTVMEDGTLMKKGVWNG